MTSCWVPRVLKVTVRYMHLKSRVTYLFQFMIHDSLFEDDEDDGRCYFEGMCGMQPLYCRQLGDVAS